jgi:hypothetical protein
MISRLAMPAAQASGSLLCECVLMKPVSTTSPHRRGGRDGADADAAAEMLRP